MPELAAHGTILFQWIERVELPKRIEIRNPLLGFLVRLLQIPVVVFVFWMIIYDTSGDLVLEPNQKGVSSISVQYDTSSYKRAAVADYARDFCINPTDYDYVWTESWRYEGYSCTSLPVDRRGWTEGDRMLYIPLSFTEERVAATAPPPVPGVAASCVNVTADCTGVGAHWAERENLGASSDVLCECLVGANKIVVGASAASISFRHHYDMYPGEFGFLSFGSAQSSDAHCNTGDWRCISDCDGCAQRDRDMFSMIMIRNDQGDETLVGTYHAPEPLLITLEDVMRMSGNSLDGLNTQASTNKLWNNSNRAGNVIKEYALMRQTGLMIRVQLQYANARQYGFVDPGRRHIPRSHVGPVCKISISVQPEWAGNPKVDCEADAIGPRCAQRYYYGVKITFDSSGFFGYREATRAITRVGSALVYFEFPVAIVRTLAMYGIGTVSEIYFAAWKMYLHIGSELAGMIFRLCTAVMAFRILATIGQSDPTKTGVLLPDGEDETNITKEALLSCIVDACENQDAKGSVKMERKGLLQMAELVIEKMDSQNSSSISLPEFIAATTSFETAQVSHAVKFFDVQRKRGPLELLFNPARQLKGSRTVYPRIPSSGSGRSGGEPSAAGTASESEVDKETIEKSISVVRAKLRQRMLGTGSESGMLQQPFSVDEGEEEDLDEEGENGDEGDVYSV